MFGDLGGRDAPLAEHLLWDVQKGHWEPLCLFSCVAVSLCHGRASIAVSHAGSEGGQTWVQIPLLLLESYTMSEQLQRLPGPCP